MKIRDDIAELLKTGKPESHIARELGVDRDTVRRARKALGLPTPQRGKRSMYPSLADVVRGNSERINDGHVRWTGYRDRRSNTPLVLYCSQRIPAPRAAFQLHYGREPVGKALPTCGMRGCIAGEHLADRPMREANARIDALYSAIFRSEA